MSEKRFLVPSTNRPPRGEAAAVRRARPARPSPDDHFDAAQSGEGQALSDPGSGTSAGIVVEAYRHHVVVQEGDTVVPCLLANAAIPDGLAPLVVGDRVAFTVEDGVGRVTSVEPRATELVRLRADRTRRSAAGGEAQVLAANVDVALIVAAAPLFHPRLVDRYLVMCQYGGIPAVVCINKCDLVADLPELTAYEGIGTPVVYASAATGQGIDELRALLRGKIAVLTGHSGVGKSSLINRLLGTDALRVGTVSTGNARGRHTTTLATLRPLEGGGYLIDTPGIRSLGLWNIDKQDLGSYFPEFEEFETACKFRDCSHAGEPGCAVRAASERGVVPAARYESYLRLMRE